MSAARGFGSDNQSGARPEVLAAIAAANEGHVTAYGDDGHTAAAVEVLRSHLGPDCEVRFCFGGTGANVVGIATVARPFEAVVCPRTAHVYTDECGAVERFAGVKLLPVETEHGKLTPEGAEGWLHGFGSEHHSQPRVLSISNVSELGTVYTPGEVRELADLAHGRGMLLHVDGARLANAAAALDVPLSALTSDAGVDVLSFGGTKNGMLYGEAVVLFGDARTADVAYVRKQAGQLPSKTRFVAAQFRAMYQADLWRESAAHANRMAALLADGAREAGVRITHPVDANEVFAIVPPEHVSWLQERVPFYVWDEVTSEVRWVTSWDTAEEDVAAFTELLRQRLAG